MIPVTIVDNFYNDPYKVRDFALKQTFSRPTTDNISWPGKRSAPIHTLDPKFHDDFVNKIFHLFFDMRRDNVLIDLANMFQLTYENYEKGWVHLDHNLTFAGIVYLTPGAPLTAGTSIYTPKSASKTGGDQKIKADFYNGNVTDLGKYRKERDEHNSLFNKTLDVSNVFNRLVIYPASEWHAENEFFGTTDADARLTQVFFARFKTDNCFSNFDRCKLLINL